MKVKVVIHKAEEGDIGQKFHPFPDVLHRGKPWKKLNRKYMKQLKDG